MVPSKWKTDHLKQINVKYFDQWIEEAKCSTIPFCCFGLINLEVNTILLFWFNDFEVFSLAHKS